MRFLKFALSAVPIAALAACAYPDAGQRGAGLPEAEDLDLQQGEMTVRRDQRAGRD